MIIHSPLDDPDWIMSSSYVQLVASSAPSCAFVKLPSIAHLQSVLK